MTGAAKSAAASTLRMARMRRGIWLANQRQQARRIEETRDGVSWRKSVAAYGYARREINGIAYLYAPSTKKMALRW